MPLRGFLLVWVLTQSDAGSDVPEPSRPPLVGVPIEKARPGPLDAKVSSMTYTGSCHCGAVRFRFRSEEITTALRCNCSMCIRKGALMSTKYYPPEDFEELVGLQTLGTYRFGDHMVNHFFCKTCGVYPFHDATTKLGHYRVNLGCVDGLDHLALAVRVIDGKAF